MGMLEGELNTAKVSLEVASSAESRARESAESMRKELARQESLVQSVKRIEAGLTNQNAEEKTRMIEETRRLSQALAEARKKHAEEKTISQSKLTVAADSLKAAEVSKNEALISASAAREKLAVSEGEVKALKEKVSNLSSQLLSLRADEDAGTSAAPVNFGGDTAAELEATKK